jgi:hypothetical protein
MKKAFFWDATPPIAIRSVCPRKNYRPQPWWTCLATPLSEVAEIDHRQDLALIQKPGIQVQ